MSSNLPKTNFFKRHVLPPLLIFLIPGFGAWFFQYAEQKSDDEIRTSAERQVAADHKLSPEAKRQILEFYRSVPVSKIMASNRPEVAHAQAVFESVNYRYMTFRWMRRIAWICLGCTVATLVIVGVSVALSFRSSAAQYWAIRIGWPVLRTSAVIQVIGQGLLAAFLSFWVTAIFFEIYVVKLILIVGVLAACAVGAMVSAIFKKVDDKCRVTGRLLSESDAPLLWRRVRDFAARLGTAPPDHIIAGIDANFFVTEHPVQLGGAVIEGRTLFISLPMLKILSVEEADAVLGHELAHFSGEDTLWSRKISPLMGKFGLYLQNLYAGISVPIALFTHAFWNLYTLSIGRRSRAREFRADQIGGSVTSPSAMKSALIKVASYCQYRAMTLNSIVESNRVNAELQICDVLEQGFPASLKAFTSDATAAGSETPHPFDSHPPLSQRLEHLGFQTAAALQEKSVHEPLTATWHDSIPSAAKIEQEMWNAQQDAIQAYHGLDLAWRLIPRTPEEVAHVLQYFPAKNFQHKKGDQAQLSYDRLQLSSWAEPVMFSQITSAVTDDHFMKKRLTIYYLHERTREALKVKLNPLEFTNAEDGNLLTAFGVYYGRHQTAIQRGGR